MSTNVNPIPEGFHSVTPYLCITGASDAIDFYKKAFDAEELMRIPSPDGSIGHAEIQIGDSHIMLSDENVEMNFHSPKSIGGTPVHIYLYVEDVDRIKNELEQLDTKCAQLTTEAQKKSSDIIEQSRKAARDAANIIEDKAKEDAQISLENAIRDIKEESQKAQLRLREESAQIAVELAAKLMEENMDAKKNQSLINRFIKNI